MNSTFVQVNGIKLHVMQAGPKDGELVILLHGFPEFWWGWHKQMHFLAKLGYRVWVPDQRGYNLSEKPSGVAAYRHKQLAADVIGLIEAAGEQEAIIVGHDWGASVAWWLAHVHPERVKRLIILNVPHHNVMERTLQSSFAQLLKSWYIFFFQIPQLPEWILRQGNHYFMQRAIVESARPKTFSPADLAKYRAAWNRPNAVQSMLNWYRAVIQRPSKTPSDPTIKMPTLVIWGTQDQFLSVEMAQKSVDLCANGQLFLIESATHWVQHDEPEAVNAAIGAFIRPNP